MPPTVFRHPLAALLAIAVLGPAPAFAIGSDAGDSPEFHAAGSLVTLPVFSTFDDDAVDAPPATGGPNQPSSLIVPPTGSILVRSASTGISTQPVEIYEGLGLDYGAIGYYFAPVTSGTVRVEATVSLDSFAFVSAFLQLTRGTAVLARVGTTALGQIRTIAGDSVGTYSPNTPFRIRVDGDVDTRTWSVSLDDELDGFDNDPVVGGQPFVNDLPDCNGAFVDLLSSLSPAVTIAYDDVVIAMDRPRIRSVDDVGNDQGRQARLAWSRSFHDSPGGSFEVTGYGIYRRQDAFSARPDRGHTIEPAVRGAGTSNGPRALLEGWDYVGSVPARGDTVYQAIAPTLCDSCSSVYFVSAMTSDPLVFFDSEPDSGSSYDNLAPAPPSNVLHLPPDELAWDLPVDEDFDYFGVYGGDSSDFAGASFIDGTIVPSYDVVDDKYPYYFVTAFDFAGNESSPTQAVHSDVSAPAGVDGGGFWLARPFPNPSSDLSTIRFSLQERSRVSVRLYDLRGSMIRKLLSGEVGAGVHELSWYGNDEAGRRVSPGVYFVRLEGAGFTAHRKIHRLN